jgi:hypothetical protein
MVAGIDLVALGFEKTLHNVGDPLDLVPAVALLGGAAAYLLAHAAFRWRNVHRFSLQRVLAAAACAGLVPAATVLPALATLGVLAALLAVLVAYERVRFAGLRERLRRQLAAA